MNAEIACALISGGVTLLVSMGTWQMSARKERDKTREDMQKTLDEYHQQTHAEIHSLQNELSQINTKVEIIETKFDDLAKQVEKHNSVIERTYKLEQAVADLRDK